MTWLTCADHLPYSFGDRLEQRGSPTVAVLHTNGGGAQVRGWFEQLWAAGAERGQGIGSTFQVFGSGVLEQYADTRRICYAEYQLSRRAVSFETQDDGDPSRPWTDAQLDTLAVALRELHDVEGIPLRLMTGPDDSGIGYHQQFSAFNQSGHNCPGPVRVHQLVAELVPSLAAPKSAFLTTTEVDMLLVNSHPGGWYVVGPGGKRHLSDEEAADYRSLGVPVKDVPVGQVDKIRDAA